jgi:hypothetical protein
MNARMIAIDYTFDDEDAIQCRKPRRFIPVEELPDPGINPLQLLILQEDFAFARHSGADNMMIDDLEESILSARHGVQP